MCKDGHPTTLYLTLYLPVPDAQYEGGHTVASTGQGERLDRLTDNGIIS